ncbi:FtsX-like permease family protein [Hathewaya histolytica]|uniref:FtsX-like permease family protein n=1 Tax=Hathewaya histolytica TaxID=1498 RepID=UPI003B680FEF
MKQLVLQLSKSNIKERMAAYITNILNITIITTFIMVILELQRIQADIKTVSKDENLAKFTAVLICISVVIIIFTLWIICIVHKTLFMQRQNFNINLKLAGISSKKLSQIYILEALFMQLPVIPIAIILEEILYYFMATYYEFHIKFIPISMVLVGILAHLVIISICLMFTMRKLAKFDVVEEMRGKKSADSLKTMGKLEFMKFIIGCTAMVVSLIFKLITKSQDNTIINCVQIAGAYLSFDAILIFMQYILMWIGKTIKSRTLVLAQMNILGYYKKTEPIMVTLIIGIMLSVGLNGMFLTCREIGRKTVEQNVYFNDLIIYQRYNKKVTQPDLENMIYAIDPDAQAAFSFGLKVLDSEGVKNEITGIDEGYLKYGEKMELVDGTDISKVINDENWDGILLPEYFISQKKLGKKYKVSLNGEALEFTIKGRFIANGSRGRYGFVSKAYLQKQLGFKGLVNMIHLKKGNQILLDKLLKYENSPNIDHISKTDIANNSYENAIKGTEIFEIGAFCIILCALLMLINYFTIISKQNNLDVARFRAMGMNKKFMIKTYITEILSIVTQSSIIGLVFAYIFESVGVKMVLPYIDVVIEPIMPVQYVIMIIIMVLVISIIIMLNTIKDSLGNKYIGFLKFRD